MNHFELFGLAINFDIDSVALSATYRSLQRQIHPDNFANSSEQERLLAVQKSSQVNDAYAILKSPIERAEYMLVLCHEDIRGEQQTLQDPIFLMAQMTQHERLEDISHSKNPEQDIDLFQDELSLEIKAYLQSFSQLIAIENYDEAANIVRKLKFIYKLQVQLSTLEDRLLNY